ncbi:hypothetical protein [Methanosphaerula subterraneus]|uniref:hypothetical protein n=1 Tax=Methanosphaerula subterraneus TaxID=3350244 RepID=UPI003F871FE6
MDTPRTAMADRSFNATNDERHQFKAYYFGNLHQYHHIIQKNVDIPVLPDRVMRSSIVPCSRPQRSSARPVIRTWT